MNNGKLIKILTQAGIAGIAIALIIANYLIITNHLNSISEYINENTKVLTEVRESIRGFNEQSNKLETTIKELNDIIKFNNRMGMGIIKVAK